LVEPVGIEFGGCESPSVVLRQSPWQEAWKTQSSETKDLSRNAFLCCYACLQEN